ncbi:MAG TPA: sugar ABC transporter permease [Pyrinomonadaceae bacterium]|nr:sugar ABC transporter permease [Pyrinomonadaceae bacterium]
MSSPPNEPAVDRPPVTADVAPPGVTTEGERQTRIAGLRLPTEQLRAYSMLFALVVIWGYFQWATVSELYPYGVFLHPVNFSKLLQQMSVTGVLAVGMLMVIVAGQIDLSVGSVVGLLGGVAALSQDWQGLGFAASLAAALLGGLLVGALQGGLVAYGNIPAFIVTLGGLLAWRGLVFILTHNETIPLQDPTFKGIGRDLLAPVVGYAIAVVSIAVIVWTTLRRNATRRRHGLKAASAGATVARIALPSVLVAAFVFYMNTQGGVPIPVVVFFSVAAVGVFLTNKTTYGRYLYAIGGNPDAARLSGISVRPHIMAAFCLMGVLAGVASILSTSRLQSASPGEGSLLELDAIAACVIGGTSLMGGRGTVFGALLGALIMASLDNGMSLIGVGTHSQQIIKGAVLVTAVWFDMLGRRRG